MNISDAISFYRALDFNLVPLGSDKRPVVIGGTKEKPFRFHWQEWVEKAQTDAYWERLQLFDWWPSMQGLAAVCGPVSGGLVCLDFDGLADGEHVADVAEALGLPRTYPWQIRSPGGGYHLWLRCPGLELDKGKLRRDGLAASAVELRYAGHYVALPPSIHPAGSCYVWAGDAPTEAPSAVEATGLLSTYEAITVPPEPKTAYNPAVQPVHGDSSNGVGGEYVSEEYAQAALKDELDQLARATEGGRNDALNTASFALGQLVADGLLSETEVITKLETTAQAIGLVDGEISATLASGLRAGLGKPRGLMLRPADVNGNGHGPTPEIGGDGTMLPVWTVEKPFELYNYKAEDGGVLDAWLAESANEWLYVAGQGYWLRWGETHWRGDEAGMLSGEIQALLRTMNDLAEYKLEDALNAKDKAGIEKATAYLAATKRTAGRVSSIVSLAQTHRAVLQRQLDGGGNLLNFPNCTYDLDSYTARPHSRDDKITHCLDYVFNETAECPRWEQFCREVLVHPGTTESDPDLIAVFQEAVGLALTSETKYEAMFWLGGEGGNGKTVAVTIIKELLGPLAMTTNFHALGDPANYELARVPGKRLLFSTESERGLTIAEGIIKNIVSGETVAARAIRQSPFEFQPVAKIFWAANNMPVIRDTSNALWRRLILLPFNREFTATEIDTGLLPKLRAELPGIFRWAVWGLYRLRQQGRFTKAAQSQQALADLKMDTNPVARWMEERATPTIEISTLSTTLYEDYQGWAKDNGHMALSSTNFGKELKRLKVNFMRSNGSRYALVLNP